jgi:hypothetical protein
VSAACRLVEALSARLRGRLLAEVGQVFAPDIAPGDLRAALRAWRARHVILPDAAVSGDARTLYESVAALEDDPEQLLLQRLPQRLADVRAPYGNWPRWDTRTRYLAAVASAVQEIAQHGSAEPGAGRAHDLWQAFRAQLDGLSDAERRWIVRTFREEFLQ